MSNIGQLKREAMADRFTGLLANIREIEAEEARELPKRPTAREVALHMRVLLQQIHDLPVLHQLGAGSVTKELDRGLLHDIELALEFDIPGEA